MYLQPSWPEADVSFRGWAIPRVSLAIEVLFKIKRGLGWVKSDASDSIPSLGLAFLFHVLLFFVVTSFMFLLLFNVSFSFS